MEACESWSEHTKRLSPLVGDYVRIQNQVGSHPTKWDKTGTVIEVTVWSIHVIRIDGFDRVTLRNRKFIRTYSPVATPTPIQLLIILCANVERKLSDRRTILLLNSLLLHCQLHSHHLTIHMTCLNFQSFLPITPVRQQLTPSPHLQPPTTPPPLVSTHDNPQRAPIFERPKRVVKHPAWHSDYNMEG